MVKVPNHNEVRVQAYFSMLLRELVVFMPACNGNLCHENIIRYLLIQKSKDEEGEGLNNITKKHRGSNFNKH